MVKSYGYKEPVTDEQLINIIEQGVQSSTGDFLNSSDLAKERLKSTYEYAGVASDHLSPQGVSSIVDTSTTEVIEAYTAILSDSSVCDIAATGGTGGGTVPAFVGDGSAARSVTVSGTSFTITGKQHTKSNKQATLLIVGNETGGRVIVPITVNKFEAQQAASLV